MTTPVDAIVVGYGWAGAIVAQRLTAEGLNVTVLERGPHRSGSRCGHLHAPGDERLDLDRTQSVSRETFTLRHAPNQRSAPFRQLGSFLSGSGMGGAGVLWGGTAPRWSPASFAPRDVYADRLEGSEHSDAVVNWPVTYAQLEPYYNRFEQQIGITGEEAGSPQAGHRSANFPVAAAAEPEMLARFRDAATAQGHSPHVLASAEIAEPYTNPLGVTREPCEQHHTTMATPFNTLHPASEESGRLRIITDAQVTRVLHDNDSATGVRYSDATGEHDLMAPIVALTAWTLHNTRLLLLSGIGQPYEPTTGRGVTGRGYANHLTIPGRGYFDEDLLRLMPGYFSGLTFSDFDPLTPGTSFLGGAQHMSHPSTNPLPTSSPPVPPGTPAWGADWKLALQHHYGKVFHMSCMGEVMPHPQRFLDLDPHYTDAWGDPLLRLTFDWRDNERRLYAHHQAVMGQVLRGMGAREIDLPPLPDHYDMARYQNTHATGGAIAGTDPETSVVDPMLRSWELDNLWVIGASAFPSSSAPPPTLTVGAYANLAADSIVAAVRTGRHELW